MSSTTISSEALTATIAHYGAELQSLADGQGRELMTDANPAFWSGRAPLLFPIVGRLNDDTLRHDGKTYTMEKHGFARRSAFALVKAEETEALFRLTDSEKTRADYPFAFSLDAHFRVAGLTFHMTVTVRNSGDGDLPFSFGYHPAFAWPLPYGGARWEHRIVFEEEERADLCRVTPYGTISHDSVPTPVMRNKLTLADALFENDALVWRSLASRRLSYGTARHRQLDIEFPDTPCLGIWTKPGAAFVCVEPWAGIADPEGYKGEYRDKPGVMTLAPGAERSFRMDVTLAVA